MSISKVMLVDDEPDIRTIARMALQSLGRWAVVMASRGQEALALAASERPDVILLDVMMPEMDGPTLLGELRKLPECAKTPIIFMTAKAQRGETEHLISLGATGIITKPFDPMTLAKEVQRLYDTRRAD